MGQSANRSIKVAAASLVCVVGIGLISFGSASMMEPRGQETDFIQIDIGSESNLLVARRAVTVGEWLECVADGTCQPRPGQVVPDATLTHVNWLDAQSYIAWRSAKDGVAYRLPTHAEWVLLAAEHAPIPLEKLFDAPELAWAADYNMNPRPLPESKLAEADEIENSFGVVGLQDSVWEWTASCRETADGDQAECSSVRIAMGTHLSILPELVSDPSKSGCGAGNPLPFVGFRIVHDQDSTLDG